MYVIYLEGDKEKLAKGLKELGLSPKVAGKLLLVDCDSSQLIEVMNTLPEEMLRKIKISWAEEEELKKPLSLLEVGFRAIGADKFLEESLFKNLMNVLGKVETYFHAILDVKTGKVIGFEALCRSEVPVYKLFKVSDRIAMLTDYFCREKALLEYRSMINQKYFLLNFHPKFFNDPLENVGELEASLQLKGISLSSIVVEVNEYEGMDLNALKMIRDFLRASGAKMALDDVGAGYAGLYQLVEIHPDIAKLDMELVRNVHLHPIKQAVVKKLTEACMDAGIRVLAEGVEKVEELEFLVDCGVEMVQGFIFARPKPLPNVKEIERLAYNLLSQIKKEV